MSSRSGSSRLPSITSSEYHSRLEALELQLVEERRRRLHVEKVITVLKSDADQAAQVSEGVAAAARSDVAPVQPSVLTELSLYMLQKEQAKREGAGSTRSSARASSANRESAPVTPKPVHPPPVAPIPKAPGRDLLSVGRNECKSQALGVSWELPKHVKPPLPPQAKGNSSCEATPNRYAKKRTDSVEVYVNKQRHDKRMELLMNFQLGPF